jgi:hypothetical protein
MKRIIYFAVFLLNFSLYAQRSGGGGQRGGRQNQNQQGQQNREPREFNASEVAGLFFYDIDKVVKKIKIRDEKTKASVAKILKDYNFKIKEISLLNADNLNDLNKIVNAEMASRRNSNNSRQNNNGGGVREKVEEIIRPIREKVRSNEDRLNEDLLTVISEKQNKKWLKYQKAQKDKLKPKRQQRNNNQGQSQRGNRQRGGF